jgi:hypothetical protein
MMVQCLGMRLVVQLYTVILESHSPLDVLPTVEVDVRTKEVFLGYGKGQTDVGRVGVPMLEM